MINCNKIKLILLTAGVLSAQSLLASDIKGAFGVNLGDTISEENPAFTGETYYSTEPGEKYTFEPNNPFGALDEYNIIVTSKSNKVYKINANSVFPYEPACENELAALKNALGKKYGYNEDVLGGVSFDKIGDRNSVSVGKGPRWIFASCHEVPDGYKLKLSYIDDEIKELSMVEAAKSEGGKYDGDGL